VGAPDGHRSAARLPSAPVPRHGDGRCRIGLDAWIAINVATQTGRAPHEVFAAHGLSLRQWTQASWRWQDLLAQDAWLATYAELREKKGIAEQTHRAAREIGAVYGPANLIRARRCHACGALKVTQPLTAYVYCDYCAALFDYDASIVFKDPTALDPAVVTAAIRSVTRAQYDAAFASGDRVEFARIATWALGVQTEVSPGEFSPRVKDPAYRRQLIDGYLAPLAVMSQFDPTLRELARAVDATHWTLEHAGWTLANVLADLAACRAAWAREYALLAESNLLANHPDGYTLEMLDHANRSTYVRPHLAMLSDRDQKALLAEVGIVNEYVAAPMVAFTDCGCGRCGAKLMMPEGAQRMLCEQCGFILELATRAFPCDGCGAILALPAVGDDVTCGYCGDHRIAPRR